MGQKMCTLENRLTHVVKFFIHVFNLVTSVIYTKWCVFFGKTFLTDQCFVYFKSCYIIRVPP